MERLVPADTLEIVLQNNAKSVTLCAKSAWTALVVTVSLASLDDSSSIISVT